MSIFKQPFFHAALLLVLSLALRSWGVSDVAQMTGDDRMQVSGAKQFLQSGHTNATVWHHPPFGLILIGASVRLFGDNPWGWHARNVLLGGLTPLLLFLIAADLFSSRWAALMAGSLLALDPLHIFLSRSSMDEVPAVFFFFLALLVTVKYLKGAIDTPVAAGLSLGLSLASKLYYIAAAPVLVIFVLAGRAGEKRVDLSSVIHLLLVFLVLPFIVYTATYFNWFAAGNGLLDFFQLQIDSFRDVKNMTYDWFATGNILRAFGAPWEWFVRLNYLTLYSFEQGGWGRYLVLTTNPVISLWVLPGMFYMLHRYRRERRLALLMVAALFLSVYAPLLITLRPIFLYSATTVMPLGFLSVSYLWSSLVERAEGRPWVYGALLAVILAIGLYHYPLATAKPAPNVLYAPIVLQAAPGPQPQSLTP